MAAGYSFGLTFTPFAKCELPFDHHGFARFNSLRHHNQVLVSHTLRDQALFDRIVRLHREQVGTLSTHLYGLAGNNRCILQDLERQCHIHVLARPQVTILVGNGGPEESCP